MARRPKAILPARPPLALKGTSRRQRAGGLILALGALGLYATTSCPTIFGADSAELAAAAAVFGIPHPPGYPLYTMIVGVAVHLAPLADAALAANLASGLFGAAALGLAFCFFVRIGTGSVPAAFGCACLGLGATFWSQCIVAEVYSLDVLLFVLAAHTALTAASAPRNRTWFVAALIAGLWLGHRPVNLVYAPALLVLALATGGWAAFRGAFKPALLGLAISALPFLYLPLASSFDPAIDVGDPENWERFKVVVSGAPYRRHLEGTTAALAAGRVVRFLTSLPREVGFAALASVVGVVASMRRQGGGRLLGAALLLFVAPNLIFASLYNILDINVYYLPSFVALAALGAVGLDAVTRRWPRRSVVLGLALLGLAGLPLNFEANDLSERRAARWAAEDLLASVDRDAVLFVQGDSTIHGLWYLQSVEQRSRRVIVVSPGHMSPWYYEQLVARFPDDDWPDYSSDTRGLTRAILHRLGETRPTYHSLLLAPDELLAGTEFGTIPSGLASRIVPRGSELSLREINESNASFFRTAIARFGEIEAEVDMDTKSIYLEYALGLSRAAELSARGKEPNVARELFEVVLRFDPDRHEADIREDVRRGLGKTVPELGLGRAARAALEVLREDVSTPWQPVEEAATCRQQQE